MITLTKHTLWMAECKKTLMGFGDLRKIYHINQMIKLSSCHCILNSLGNFSETIVLPNRKVDENWTATSNFRPGQHPGDLVERNITSDLEQ
jgi:hypothetical protein